MRCGLSKGTQDSGAQQSMMSCLGQLINSLAKLGWLISRFREGLICKTNRAWEIVSQINIMVRRADDGNALALAAGTKEKDGAPDWGANMERAASGACLLLSGWAPDMQGVEWCCGGVGVVGWYLCACWYQLSGELEAKACGLGGSGHEWMWRRAGGLYRRHRRVVCV